MKKSKTLVISLIAVAVIAAAGVLAIYLTKPHFANTYVQKQVFPEYYLTTVGDYDLAKALINSFDKPTLQNQSAAKALLAEHLKSEKKSRGSL